MSRFMLGITVVAALISLMAHASPIAILDKRLMTVFTVQPDTLGEWAVEDSYGRHTTEPFKSFKSVDYKEFSACLLECAQNTACGMLQWTGGHPTAGSATQESQLPTCKLYKELNMQSVGPMDPEAPDGECLMARLGDFPNPNPKSPSYKVELTWTPAAPVASLEKRDMQVFTVQNKTRGTWTDSRGILVPLAIHESPNFTSISSCMALCVQNTACKSFQWKDGHPSQKPYHKAPNCALYNKVWSQTTAPWQSSEEGEMSIVRLGDHPNPEAKTYPFEFTYTFAT